MATSHPSDLLTFRFPFFRRQITDGPFTDTQAASKPFRKSTPFESVRILLRYWIKHFPLDRSRAGG